ncbi:MAG: flagellar hook-associated protein FlgK [Lachnospiraceae bacterium]|nr:flagellar hook-associated protein FlgK [Lachnospiraceae bacterium]
MSNGFGSLYVGSSGLRSAQNGLNVLSNNISNIDTKGYVRRKVIYEDTFYTSFGNSSVSKQQTGLGVQIGEVVHARDIFLDQAYRKENGRASFYEANYDAAYEVQTQLQEMYGKAFQTAISDVYEAFAEYAKDPNDTVNQNLVIQKAQLFVSRAQGVNDGLREYQMTINTKVKNDVDRVNEIGKEIVALNKEIQRIEAGGVETAMALRDQRDKDLDELSALANITYTETADGLVNVRLEGSEFVTEVTYNEIGLHENEVTGFEEPYWVGLSEPDKEKYYDVFDIYNINPITGHDTGEIKGLMLARGLGFGNYTDIKYLSATQYNNEISNSVVQNAQAELDKLVNTIVTQVNDLLCPNINYDASKHNGQLSGVDENGAVVALSGDTIVLDSENAPVGEDGKLPPQELFTRSGSSRYKKVTLGDGEEIYVYQQEDIHDLSTCYSIKSLSVNSYLTDNPQQLPHLKQNGDVAYDIGEKIYSLWEVSNYTLNPADESPTTLGGFYTKFIGELASIGSVYKTTSESLAGTRATIESSRQSVIGVSSDEELTNMIKYQNAYNASSRYINVVNEMIEYLLNSLYS